MVRVKIVSQMTCHTRPGEVRGRGEEIVPKRSRTGEKKKAEQRLLGWTKRPRVPVSEGRDCRVSRNFVERCNLREFSGRGVTYSLESLRLRPQSPTGTEGKCWGRGMDETPNVTRHPFGHLNPPRSLRHNKPRSKEGNRVLQRRILLGHSTYDRGVQNRIFSGSGVLSGIRRWIMVTQKLVP